MKLILRSRRVFRVPVGYLACWKDSAFNLTLARALIFSSRSNSLAWSLVDPLDVGDIGRSCWRIGFPASHTGRVP